MTYNYLENEIEDVDITEKGVEWCDVTIRCYLLSQAISKAIEELESEGF